MKKLKSFNTLFEAEIVKGLLNNEGIESLILNQMTGNIFPYTGNHPGSKPYIAVADEDFDRANEILNQVNDNNN